jgi:hypothetical protein
VVIGHDPSTALGRHLGGETRVTTSHALAAAIDSAERPVGVVVCGVTDQLAAIGLAVARGSPVLVESVGTIATDDLAHLAGSGRVFAGLRRRFESDARWARGRVAGGGIGLTWGIHAEALASRAPDPLTEAIDLLDVSSLLTGCAPVAARRADRGREAPTTWLVELERGITGQLVVRLATPDERGPDAQELAAVRLLASHGYVSADLDGPVQRTQGGAGSRIEHVGADGAERALAAFRDVVAGNGGTAPLPLGAVVAMRRLLDERRGGREQPT